MLQSMPDLPRQFSHDAGQPEGHLDQWAAAFQDPQLLSLVDEAMLANPDLLRTQAVWQEAMARIRTARSALRPSLTGGYSVSETDDANDPDSQTRQSLDLSASWELDVWGRLRHDSAAARETALASALDYAYARQSLAAAVAQAWFTAIEAQQQLEIARNLEEVQSLTAKITEAKRNLGAGVALDAEVAMANLALARNSVEQNQQALEQSLRALELLLGRYPEAEVKTASTFPDMPSAPPAGLPARLLERRPDLVAADRRVAAAFHLTESARAARLPSVTLSASLGTLLDPTEAIWSLGANLLAPIYTGGRLEAEVEINEARQVQALQNYVNVGLRAFAEVEAALAAEHYLSRRITQLEIADDSLRQASDIAHDRYEAGVITILDLTQVRQQFFSARSELLSARSNLLQQRIGLYLALGGSYDDAPVTAPAPLDDEHPRSDTRDAEETP